MTIVYKKISTSDFRDIWGMNVSGYSVLWYVAIDNTDTLAGFIGLNLDTYNIREPICILSTGEKPLPFEETCDDKEVKSKLIEMAVKDAKNSLSIKPFILTSPNNETFYKNNGFSETEKLKSGKIKMTYSPLLQSINTFCKIPSYDNWRVLSGESKTQMVRFSKYCIEHNKGKIAMAKSILKHSRKEKSLESDSESDSESEYEYEYESESEIVEGQEVKTLEIMVVCSSDRYNINREGNDYTKNKNDVEKYIKKYYKQSLFKLNYTFIHEKYKKHFPEDVKPDKKYDLIWFAGCTMIAWILQHTDLPNFWKGWFNRHLSDKGVIAIWERIRRGGTKPRFISWTELYDKNPMNYGHDYKELATYLDNELFESAYTEIQGDDVLKTSIFYKIRT